MTFFVLLLLFWSKFRMRFYSDDNLYAGCGYANSISIFAWQSFFCRWNDLRWRNFTFLLTNKSQKILKRIDTEGGSHYVEFLGQADVVLGNIGMSTRILSGNQIEYWSCCVSECLADPNSAPIQLLKFGKHWVLKTLERIRFVS